MGDDNPHGADGKSNCRCRGAGFALATLDCRTESCVGTVRWNSRSARGTSGDGCCHLPIRPNCARSMLLTDEPSADGTLEATVVFDCKAWRDDGSPLVPVPQESPANHTSRPRDDWPSGPNSESAVGVSAEKRVRCHRLVRRCGHNRDHDDDADRVGLAAYEGG